MTEQEFKTLLNSLDEINKNLQKLDNLNQLEKLNKTLVENENRRIKYYNDHIANGSLWIMFALVILSTVIGIWGFNFQWFAGIAFGVVFTSIIYAFYYKIRL